MTRFSEDAWRRTEPLRAAIHRLPFNTELAAGTLAPDRFRFYILQDAIYLGEYARVLAVAAAKAPDAETVRAFCQAATEAIAVERALHGMAEHGETDIQGLDEHVLANALAGMVDNFAYAWFILKEPFDEDAVDTLDELWVRSLGIGRRTRRRKVTE